ncbi:uncharacterized protein CPUR_05544 [Claviceps purpurea 20.1]|uniref:F-box domain-containing protein n=1 Tax=Claviceps purpurea (strain 20.1) TaxID=1111077 RepID=M1W883_CLAP2|nr:uncharacterized protein CPUR_05544 [Claviceps purpurea 20.1]
MFDMVFPIDRDLPTGSLRDASTRHLKDYSWLRGAPSVQELGCYDFSFSPNPNNDEHLPLVQFLATFPNLQTLTLSPHHNYRCLSSVVMAILRLTHLKTIYTSGGHTVSNELRQAAQAHGVQMKYKFSSQPPWPRVTQ